MNKIYSYRIETLNNENQEPRDRIETQNTENRNTTHSSTKKAK